MIVRSSALLTKLEAHNLFADVRMRRAVWWLSYDIQHAGSKHCHSKLTDWLYKLQLRKYGIITALIGFTIGHVQ